MTLIEKAEKLALNSAHVTAFDTALQAAVTADGHLRIAFPSSRNGAWVDHGDGHDGYRVMVGLTRWHFPPELWRSYVAVDYVTDHTPEVSGTVLYTEVAPRLARNIDHLVELALTAIREHHANRDREDTM
ncbi:hypothetical protein [Nonomuraea sp. NPDC023979]|uniref:hypothetical protein n=1 Tax=Nonomuraea sp. NPDC023979 TaxID=3154796 RepID=UPI0033F548BB